MTYLRRSGLRRGDLLHYVAALRKDGIVRMVNGLTEGRWSTNLSAFLFPLCPLRLCESSAFQPRNSTASRLNNRTAAAISRLPDTTLAISV